MFWPLFLTFANKSALQFSKTFASAPGCYQLQPQIPHGVLLSRMWPQSRVCDRFFLFFPGEGESMNTHEGSEGSGFKGHIAVSDKSRASFTNTGHAPSG